MTMFAFTLTIVGAAWVSWAFMRLVDKLEGRR